MCDMSLDEYFDIIDDSTTTYFRDECGAEGDFKENRVLRSCVINLIEPHLKGSKTVLDVGVGQGVNSLFFLKNGYVDKLVGMDNDSKVLDMFLQNAKMLGVDSKVNVVEWDLIYGIDTSFLPDCILCMDMLYGDPSSGFGKNSDVGSLQIDNKITVGALSDLGADKIIITRHCRCVTGTCMNPYDMKEDLEEVGYHVVDFGNIINDDSALDYAIATRDL